MEQDSNLLLQQIKRTHTIVVWNHKIWECAADVYAKRDNGFKIAQIVLSAITTSGLVSVCVCEQFWVAIISTLISTGLLIINTFLKGKNYMALAGEYGKYARKYLSLRESYYSLIVDIIRGGLDATEIVRRRDELQKQLNELNSEAPRSFKRAVKLANKSLNTNHDSSFSQEELNQFLSLRYDNSTSI